MHWGWNIGRATATTLTTTFSTLTATFTAPRIIDVTVTSFTAFAFPAASTITARTFIAFAGAFTGRCDRKQEENQKEEGRCLDRNHCC